MRFRGSVLKMGADPLTFAGLAGMGDMIVTCTSKHSRNRRVGEEIGKGKSLNEVLKGMEMVAEGVWTTKSALETGGKIRGRNAYNACCL